MTFYVIGNGFDQHYGLKTSYKHFKEFLIDNGYSDLVRKVDELFYNHGYDPKAIEEWNKFEDMLTVFNQLRGDDLYDEAMANAETDDERADYFESPAWNVSYYNKYIEVLKQQFDVWVGMIDTRIVKDSYFQPQKGDCVLNFNYTTTIEDNFDTSEIEITHIHGTINHEIVLGHNEYQAPDLMSDYADEYDYDYRDITTRQAVNRILDQASTQYYKNSPMIFEQYKPVFDSVPTYDKVVIMGLSCGEQDKMYVYSIIGQAKVVDFYYRSDSAKERMEACVAGTNVKVNYIHW